MRKKKYVNAATTETSNGRCDGGNMNTKIIIKIIYGWMYVCVCGHARYTERGWEIKTFGAAVDGGKSS